jgi:hypothetical protein
MDFANPSYIQSDYMTSLAGDEKIAGDRPRGAVLHPTTQAKFRQQEQQIHQQDPHHYRVQREQIPSGSAPLPYNMRADVAPYTLNYEYANTPQSMAHYSGFAGIFDDTLSAQATPFKTALATSSLILIGAVFGEMTLGNALGKKIDKYYAKKKLPVGMGALIGAITANALRMGIASQLSSGWKPALTSLVGGMMPISIPIALTFLDKPNLKDNKTKIALVLGGIGFMSVPFIIKLTNKNGE